MRRVFFFMMVLCWSILTQAQHATGEGMQFEHAASWDAVLAKAKQQNKLVFVDCYTTWCIPCKRMSNEVFTKQEVGAFYNAHYMNVKAKVDSVASDDAYTKSWHPYAAKLARDYKVQAYPTYLIFNGDGKLVDRFTGYMPPPEFIEKGKSVLDPANQYYVQLDKYEAGDKSPTLLLKLIKMAHAAYDQSMERRLVTEYMATQKDLYTKENLALIYSVAKSTSDTAFKIAVENGDKADKVLGEPGRSKGLVEGIILNQELPPLLKAENPDFAKLEADLKVKCPKYASYITAHAKISYYYQKGQWDRFVKQGDEMMALEEDGIRDKELNELARLIFANVSDQALLEKAMNWSKASLQKEEKAAYHDTYANLLYKTGKTKEGVVQEKRALELAKKAGVDTKPYEEHLSKMEKGAPTWEQHGKPAH